MYKYRVLKRDPLMMPLDPEDVRRADLSEYQLWLGSCATDGAFELIGRHAILGGDTIEDLQDKLLEMLHATTLDVLNI